MSGARLATFRHQGTTVFGRIEGDQAIALSPRFPQFPTLREAIEAGALPRLAEADGAAIALSEIAFAPPIPAPEKIICVGVNFPDRNAEYKDGTEAPPNPSLFVRFPRSFVGHDQPILRPPESDKLDYEGEIAIVIGKPGRRIPQARALDHVAALTLAQEGTLRDWVRHAKFNVTQGKNFDASGAMGPWLTPFSDEAQIADIALETRVNGELRQSDRTSRMIFPFRKIIEYVSTFATLVPGDVILCGTPTGAGARFDPPRWLVPGDVVEVTADGLGTLRNRIEDER